MNDRRWNNRPVCNYCSRVGYFANNCRERFLGFNPRQQFDQPSRPFMDGTSGRNQEKSMLSEILTAVRGLQVGSSQNEPTVQNLEVRLDRKTKVPKTLQAKTKDESKVKQASISSWETFRIGPKLFPLIIVMIIAFISPVMSYETVNSQVSNDLSGRKTR